MLAFSTNTNVFIAYSIYNNNFIDRTWGVEFLKGFEFIYVRGGTKVISHPSVVIKSIFYT